MKVLRSLLAIFLIIIIVGGLGYIGWTLFMNPMNHTGMNTAPNTNTPNQQMPNNHQMPGTQQPNQAGNTQQNNTALNTVAIQNRDKLSQAIGTINQAIDMITIDPYSKTTVPNTTNNMGNMDGQSTQNPGIVNIYPSGNTSVNISPNTNIPPANTTQPAPANTGNANQQNINYVYDQGKLQQLHSGIFTLAQGIMLINQLNDDLSIQSAAVEANPANYQTYLNRYNNALQNKTKLNKAISMLEQASTLVNVNPYASPNGYQYNVQGMQQLHQGVYKLAQGMTMLGRLNEDFTNQMAQASLLVQNASNTSNAIAGMNHGIMTGIFGTLNITTVFNIVLIIMVVGLIIGIFGAILSMLKPRSKDNIGPSEDTKNP